MKDRLKYLDVAKFIGIFCIYIGHFGAQAGNAYLFVFSFHVPLFFFLSGCAETLSSSTITWHKSLVKNIKVLLIPMFFFAFSSLVILCIQMDTHLEIPQNLILILKGCVRNQFFAASLWFLSCLFVIKTVFYFMRRVLKNKVSILVVCLILYIIAATGTIGPIPYMPYNVDSACFYIIYYALGYCLIDPIKRLLCFDQRYKKLVCACVGVVCFIYTARLFFGKDLLAFMHSNAVLTLFVSPIRACIIIFLVLLVSKILENVKIFNDLGRNTLYLCGSEYIIRLLLPLCLQMLGLYISIPNPIAAYIYTMVLLVICNETLVPLEKTIFRKLKLL